jgi:predicted nucleic acid-binding protein
MTSWLLDTNIVSELRRPRPLTIVTRDTAEYEQAGVSVVNPWS